MIINEPAIFMGYTPYGLLHKGAQTERPEFIIFCEFWK